MNVVALNPRAVIGSKNPPGCIDTARGVYTTLANFLKETPVIQSHDEAKKGANLTEQAICCNLLDGNVCGRPFQ